MKIQGPNGYNKYALDVQLKFLEYRFKREMLCNKDSKHFIIDRSIFEDRYIFAQNIAESGMITQGEFDEYLRHFREREEMIMKPSFLIFLKCDPKILMERINKRGREMEKDISLDYLENLNRLYVESFEKNADKNFKGIDILSYQCDEMTPEELCDAVHHDITEMYEFTDRLI